MAMEIPNFLKRTQCFSLSDEGKILKEINSRSDSISDIKIRNQEEKRKKIIKVKNKVKEKKKKNFTQEYQKIQKSSQNHDKSL